eukprot:CAMPEP_0168472562 /NCGR_PEP_ID=MMETSP0228-20121227/59865_1 /TAXON_ID=133427 /ORGANISM="Protoceratium reticulatum, Strain CCCM 535 (=CCMP 1889)" /LENGTH=110 /DNA_ID=CAMNT_0008488513 /DNA_START=435 /DNA_END=762 /DNA_ORIENTATION=+
MHLWALTAPSLARISKSLQASLQAVLSVEPRADVLRLQTLVPRAGGRPGRHPELPEEGIEAVEPLRHAHERGAVRVEVSAREVRVLQLPALQQQASRSPEAGKRLLQARG